MADQSERPAWHALEPEEVLLRLGTTRDGLTHAEAERRRRDYGPNELPRPKPEGPLVLLWRQIHNPLIWVLLGAALLAFALGKATDAIVVLTVVVLNTIIGFAQEYRAGKAIEALSRMVPEHAVVIRDGRREQLPAQQVVPGEIVLLASGDRVPADMRVIDATNLQAEEAALTGESVPAPKRPAAVGRDAVVGDRACMVFGGTVITTGTARAAVVETGERTELGRISHLLHETVHVQTPLTRQLAVLGRYITVAVVVVSALLLPVSVVRGYAWVDAMLVAIALAVAAIPEGLPAIVTIALAFGVQRMARRRAIIRRLPAVETLGSTTVICTDKTGTLTRNEMTVQSLWTPAAEYELTGVGYAPDGALLRAGEPLGEPPPEVQSLLTVAALCNDASLHRPPGQGVRLAGDPTEGAMVVAAEKVGLNVEELRRRYARTDAVPFESEQQFMATAHASPDGGSRVLMKGAPEVVLRYCDLRGESTLEAIHHAIERMAERGMRVLAVAEKERSDATGGRPLREEVARGGLRLLGLQGMIDPPRPEAVAAVKACHGAGIEVKMITGDHRLTAKAIGAELGLGDAPAVTGSELATFDEARLRDVARQTRVFARVAPEHKLRLVRALQQNEQVVAMTGDGVNDAPALKQANIGVAMGITGTAVAQQSADIILTDDNFASIESAVEEGRRVYDNLIKSFAFVLPTNVGLALILVAAVALFPIQLIAGELVPLLPLLPRQILWINLVASVALSFPLALEVAEPDIMRRRPRSPKEPVFGPFLIGRTVVVAVLMAAGALGLFLWEYTRDVGRVGHDLAASEAQTMAVTTIALFQIFYMLNCRSLRESVWRIGLASNPSVFVGIGALLVLQLAFIYLPFMNRIFGTAPLPLDDLGFSTAVAAIILPVISVEKAWRSRRRGTGSSRRQPRAPSRSVPERT